MEGCELLGGVKNLVKAFKLHLLQHQKLLLTALTALDYFMFLFFVFFSDHRQRTPIIVVPAAATSVITLWNVKEFLEDYKLVVEKCVYNNNIECLALGM